MDGYNRAFGMQANRNRYSPNPAIAKAMLDSVGNSFCNDKRSRYRRIRLKSKLAIALHLQHKVISASCFNNTVAQFT
jgi:hypothetical protein